MININFTNDNVLEAVNEAIKYFDIPQARRVLKYLNSEAANLSDGQVAKNYNSVIYQLRYLLLPTLDEKEIISLFSQHIVEAIKNMDLDLEERLRAKLVEIDFFEDRDAFKKQLIAGLQNNNELLTSRNFIEDTDDKSPTVMNWLRRYQEFIGPGVDSVKRAEFFVKYGNYIQLDEREKDLIKKLVNLYEFLKLPSSDPRALWEEFVLVDEGKLKSLNREGKIEVIGEIKEDDELEEELGNKAELELQKIMNDYPGADTDKTETEEAVAIKNSQELDTLEASAPPPPTQVSSKLAGDIIKTPPAPISPTIKPEPVPKPASQSSTPFIHPVPQSFRSSRPALIFDMEDEKEADKHRDKAGQAPVLENVIRAYVDEVIKEKNLIFKDEINKRRFIQLMVSRLKDVRGPLEVAEALRKPVEAGGLGMAEEKADQVQGIVENAKKEFESRIKNQELIVPEPVAEPPTAPTPIKVETPKPSFDAEAAKQWREQMLKEIQSQGQPMSETENGQPASSFAVKPQLSDVKSPPKVVGPLEELRGLTLIDFRRLGGSPQEALQKIKGKIDLLGETSIGRRLEAVRAWKTSNVYQLYLRLGRESIELGKPISVIVGNHQTLGEPVLTEEEFNSIADFNARLRF